MFVFLSAYPSILSIFTRDLNKLSSFIKYFHKSDIFRKRFCLVHYYFSAIKSINFVYLMHSKCQQEMYILRGQHFKIRLLSKFL
jgi:hypothetical protein